MDFYPATCCMKKQSVILMGGAWEKAWDTSGSLQENLFLSSEQMTSR